MRRTRRFRLKVVLLGALFVAAPTEPLRASSHMDAPLIHLENGTVLESTAMGIVHVGPGGARRLVKDGSFRTKDGKTLVIRAGVPVASGGAAPSPAIHPPALDDRNFERLPQELQKRIPAHTPEWTDHQDADPGVTMIDPATGEIRFGDGIQGQRPPAGQGNVKGIYRMGSGELPPKASSKSAPHVGKMPGPPAPLVPAPFPNLDPSPSRVPPVPALSAGKHHQIPKPAKGLADKSSTPSDAANFPVRWKVLGMDGKSSSVDPEE